MSAVAAGGARQREQALEREQDLERERELEREQDLERERGQDRDGDRIQAPGTPEELWRAWPGLDRLKAASCGDVPLEAVRSMVVVAAHPDDEILGVGGLMALLAHSGAALRVVVATDGEASHGSSRAVRPAELARRRRAECLAGLTALGAVRAQVARLRLPDSGLEARSAELTARLRGLVAGFDLCVAPWSADAHPDHEAVGRAAREACADGAVPFMEFPVWMWHWAGPGDRRVPWERARRVELPPWAMQRKRAAIACHSSQILPLGPRSEDAAILPPEELEHFARGFETVLVCETEPV